MEIRLRRDTDPEVDFYYRHQFEIYHEPYLIWDRETWKIALERCAVYRIEVDGDCAGDVLLEGEGRGARSIVDLGLLPEYRGRGIGKAVFKQIKGMNITLTAVTRKETLDFFLKSGFVLKGRIRNYYAPGVDGYSISFSTEG
jgi:ribosomal protein S18 acetylase RimI-like enzyme